MTLEVTANGGFLQVSASGLEDASGNCHKTEISLTTDGGQHLEDVVVVRDKYGEVVRLGFTVVGEIEARDLFDCMAALSKVRGPAETPEQPVELTESLEEDNTPFTREMLEGRTFYGKMVALANAGLGVPFAVYISVARERVGICGDFARDTERDPSFKYRDYGDANPLEGVLRYLENQRACPAAVKAAKQLYGEYKKFMAEHFVPREGQPRSGPLFDTTDWLDVLYPPNTPQED